MPYTIAAIMLVFLLFDTGSVVTSSSLFTSAFVSQILPITVDINNSTEVTSAIHHTFDISVSYKIGMIIPAPVSAITIMILTTNAPIKNLNFLDLINESINIIKPINITPKQVYPSTYIFLYSAISFITSTIPPYGLYPLLYIQGPIFISATISTTSAL